MNKQNVARAYSLISSYSSKPSKNKFRTKINETLKEKKLFSNKILLDFMTSFLAGTLSLGFVLLYQKSFQQNNSLDNIHKIYGQNVYLMNSIIVMMLFIIRLVSNKNILFNRSIDEKIFILPFKKSEVFIAKLCTIYMQQFIMLLTFPFLAYYYVHGLENFEGIYLLKFYLINISLYFMISLIILRTSIVIYNYKSSWMFLFNIENIFKILLIGFAYLIIFNPQIQHIFKLEDDLLVKNNIIFSISLMIMLIVIWLLLKWTQKKYFSVYENNKIYQNNMKNKKFKIKFNGYIKLQLQVLISNEVITNIINNIIVILFIISFGIVGLIKYKEIINNYIHMLFTNDTAEIKIIIALIFNLILFLLVSFFDQSQMNMISLDGKFYDVLKTLPIRKVKYLCSKIFIFNFTPNLIILIFNFVVAYTFDINIITVLLSFVSISLVFILMSSIKLYFDSHNPYTNWDTYVSLNQKHKLRGFILMFVNYAFLGLVYAMILNIQIIFDNLLVFLIGYYGVVILLITIFIKLSSKNYLKIKS